jgi:hypothetical protein
MKLFNHYLVLGVLALSFAGLAGSTTYVVNGSALNANDNNAGITNQPFRTIQHAADVAQAGDLVLIEPGTYAESVSVPHSGTPDHPIVFESIEWHGVTMVQPDEQAYQLFGSAIAPDAHLLANYITVRGVVFRHDPSVGYQSGGVGMAVGVGRGWRYEDCVISGNGGLCFFGTSARDNCDDFTLLRTIIEDCYGCGASGAGADTTHPLNNDKFINCIFRRNNSSNIEADNYRGGVEILCDSNLLLDGDIVYDNNGSGVWLDTPAVNFIVRNCTFFGNHSGYAVTDDGKPVGDQREANSGFCSEANIGPGLIENSVFYSNLSYGVADADSGSQGAITIHNNWFVANGGVGISIRGMVGARGHSDTGDRLLGAAKITYNVFKDNGQAWGTSNEQLVLATPAAVGSVIDYNTYDIPSDHHGPWVSCKATDAKARITASSLADMQHRLGVEIHGQVAHLAFRGPLIHVYAYPTAQDALHPDPAKLHQVPSQDAETQHTIDRALDAQQATVGQVLSIPVYGHTPITHRGQTTECQVYDLACRYVRLTLPNAAAVKTLTDKVTPYAIIAPTYLTVKLTEVSPYDIAAMLVSAH